MRRTLAPVVLPLGLRRAAATPPVDLALVLAVDASGSVDLERFNLQRDGYAAALRDRRVLAAIRGGRSGAIGISMLQWSWPEEQVVVLPWQRIDDDASAAAAAAAIAAAPRQLFGGPTAIGAALDFAIALFDTLPFDATRRVIDISGDGANNRGDAPDGPRDRAAAKGITINGLPIVALEPDLGDYYTAHVIGGPGAFLVVVASYEQFPAAIRQKLIQEIAALP